MFYGERTRLLAARRESLVLRAQDQRVALARRARSFAPLAWVERGSQAWAYARSHPWVVVLPVIALTALGPRRVARALTRVLVVWRVVRSLRRLLDGGQRHA